MMQSASYKKSKLFFFFFFKQDIPELASFMVHGKVAILFPKMEPNI
jgi:hypothetical protein